ncbi:MAG: hypothetical protein VB024_11615 [Dysgonamonadaceae bacterium]|nr:hypothetical protein [Dysgonamonadaceae bacterium]
MGIWSPEPYQQLLNRFQNRYRDHILGLMDNTKEIKKLLQKILKQPIQKDAIVLIYQRIFIVRTWAEREGLVEVLRNMDAFNKVLVDIIAEIRPDIDTTALLDPMKLNICVAEAYKEIYN